MVSIEGVIGLCSFRSCRLGLRSWLEVQAEAALRQAAIVSWLASTTAAATTSADPSSMMTRLHLESPQLNQHEAFRSQGPEQLLARLFSTGQAVQAGPMPASLASLSSGPQGEQTHLDALLDQVGMESSHSSERAFGSGHLMCAQQRAAWLWSSLASVSFAWRIEIKHACSFVGSVALQLQCQETHHASVFQEQVLHWTL